MFDLGLGGHHEQESDIGLGIRPCGFGAANRVAVVAGLVGLAIGCVDGIICRLPRRALLSGLVGLVVGFIGGFISSIVAGMVYTPLNALAMHQMSGGSLNTVGFGIQMIGRSLAWDWQAWRWGWARASRCAPNGSCFTVFWAA